MGLSRDQFDEAKRQYETDDQFRNKALDMDFEKFEAQQDAEESRFARDLTHRGSQLTLEETVAKAGLTGMVDGEATIANIQRMWQNKMTETELFGGSPPVTYMAQDINNSINTKTGDEAYNPLFDLNGDGTISFAEGVDVLTRSEAGGNGVMMFTPPGPQTLAAQSLGLEEDKLVEQSRQFDEQMKTAVDQFMAEFTGRIFQPDPITGILTWTPGLDSLQMDEAKRQFNERMTALTDQFEKQMGIERDKLNSNDLAAWLGLLSAISQSAGTVIASGRSGSNSNIPGGTVPGSPLQITLGTRTGRTGGGSSQSPFGY